MVFKILRERNKSKKPYWNQNKPKTKKGMKEEDSALKN